MVAFDATTIMLTLAPTAGAPRDSKGDRIRFAKERIDGLIADLAQEKTKIIIPTPALSEAIVRSDASVGAQYIAKLKQSRHFVMGVFDERAALEVALWTKVALDGGDKKDGSDQTWAKVKYDRQIAAIAKVNGASALYTNDENLRKFATRRGLRVIGIEELPVPDAVAQMRMFDETRE